MAGLTASWRPTRSAALHEGDDFDGVAVVQHDFAALVAWHDIAVEFDGHALGAKPALFDELRDADRRVERFLLSVDDHDDPSRWCCASAPPADWAASASAGRCLAWKATKNGSVKKSYLLGGALLHDPVMLVLLFGCFTNRIRLIRVRHDDDGAALATGKEAYARRPTVGRIIGDWANAKGNHGTNNRILTAALPASS